MEEKFYYSGNNLSTIIKDLAMLFVFLAVVIGVVICIFFENIILGIALAIGFVIFALLLYSLGEIVGLLTDIRENTEHLRDNIKE